VRIFVTGANGQLGHELVRCVAEAGHTAIASTHESLDITNEQAVHAAIAEAQPNVVIHAAAWTAVDACESDRSKAMLVNGAATAFIANAAHAVGAHVLYISTDYVFDGTKTSPYVEADIPNPTSVYGESKLAGERALSDTDAIVRIAWVSGYHGANMVKTILRLRNEPQLRFVNDQIGNPTFADDAAAMIVRLAIEKRPGIWHITNQGIASWYDFAREVLLAAGQDANKVQPIATSELQPPRPAQRPANSVLHNGALLAAGIQPLPDYRDALQRLVRRLLADEQE
jgi:dTDP-4-dehydrorhamnose reductase